MFVFHVHVCAWVWVHVRPGVVGARLSELLCSGSSGPPSDFLQQISREEAQFPSSAHLHVPVKLLAFLDHNLWGMKCRESGAVGATGPHTHFQKPH